MTEKNLLKPIGIGVAVVFTLLTLFACGKKQRASDAEIFHTVFFADFDETVLDIQQVPDGEAATAPKSPVRDGYAFIGWNADFSHVTSDLIVIAMYEHYSDLFGLSVEREEADRLTLGFSLNQISNEPAPILGFQLRIYYSENFTVVSTENGNNVTSSYLDAKTGEPKGYISVLYINYDKEVIKDSFEYIKVTFDTSNCISGEDTVYVETMYVLDVDGNDIKNAIDISVEYLYE